MFMDGCWKTLEKEIYVENIKKKNMRLQIYDNRIEY